MNYREQMAEIMRQRERLLVRCEAQRVEISALVSRWEKPLALADRAIAAVGYLREHPVVLGSLVALLAVIQRRGWWLWARRGYLLWRSYVAFRDSDAGIAG